MKLLIVGIVLLLLGCCDTVTNPLEDCVPTDTLTWYVNYDNGVPIDTVYITDCDKVLFGGGLK